ncbi:MAG: BcepIL02 [Variovorax sp.]|nr:BcepIL02 [Variovorax sp.]
MTTNPQPAAGNGGAAQPNRYEQLKGQLERSKQGFLPLLGGSRQNVEKFVSVVLQAAMDNPELLEADRRSFIAGCMKAAKDGLMPDGREAFLNVYSTKVKDRATGREHWIKLVSYQPMVGGLVKALYEHPDVDMVDAAAVFRNDHFKFVRGDNPRLEHEPTMEDDAGPVIAAYMVVKLKNGQIKREVMPRRDIEKVRAASKAGESASGPWKKWYDQQAIKSVIKRGAKQLPRHDHFNKIEQSDNEALGFSGTPSSVADVAARNAVPALEHAPIDYIEPVMDGGDYVEAGGSQQHAGEQQQQQQHADEDERPAKPALTSDALKAKEPQLRNAIASGAKVNDLITALETRNSVSLEQKTEIASWAQPTEGASN